MWHASISPYRSGITRTSTLFAIAERVLEGVGDRFAGEWREVGQCAVHLRRRLTAIEAAEIDPVCDIRGTPEAAERVRAMRRVLPPHVPVPEE